MSKDMRNLINKIKTLNEDWHSERDAEEMRGANRESDRGDRSGNLDKYGLPIENEREWDENVDMWLFDDVQIYTNQPFKVGNNEIVPNKKYDFYVDESEAEKYIDEEELSEKSYLPSMFMVSFGDIEMPYNDFLKFYENNKNKFGIDWDTDSYSFRREDYSDL